MVNDNSISDKVLWHLKVTPNHITKLSELREVLQIPIENLKDVVIRLKAHDYIVCHTPSTFIDEKTSIKIKDKGKVFITDGGYTKLKWHEDLQIEESITSIESARQAVQISRRANLLSIVSIVIAGLALIAAIIQLLM